jgi:hypothetical protein
MAQPDRLPVDLLAMPQADALLKISHWLEDCQQHLDLARPGGLPTPPFGFTAAWIVTRLAAGAGVKPDYAPGDEIVVGVDLSTQADMTAEFTVRTGGGGIEILATQEWFDRHAADDEGRELLGLLCGPGIARPTGILSGGGFTDATPLDDEAPCYGCNKPSVLVDINLLPLCADFAASCRIPEEEQ